MLEKPNCLIGVKEPDMRMLWAYTKGLQESIDICLGRHPAAWSHFTLQVKRLGARTELRVLLDERLSFTHRVNYLQELYQDYETWANSQEWVKTHESPDNPHLVVCYKPGSCSCLSCREKEYEDNV